jgi:hypothetical protein
LARIVPACTGLAHHFVHAAGQQNIYKVFVVGFPTATHRNCFNFDSDEGMFRLELTEGNWVSLPLGFSGVKVNSLALAGERLYAATNQGVARLSGGTSSPGTGACPPGRTSPRWCIRAAACIAW